ncbi:MAG: type VI secretion system baseplate subunit TssG [Myxococcales bacterium]
MSELLLDRAFEESLRRRLANEGETFGFFQAVQLLQRLVPDAVPVGELGPVGQEAVRFEHDPALVFSASDVSSIRFDPSGRAHMVTTFLGLSGSVSPLATVFAEDLLRAIAEEQPALRAFYDIFHHRLISLFFRTWKKYRFFAGFRVDGTDLGTRRSLAFLGVDPAAPLPTQGLCPFELLALAPVLAQRTRPARSLGLVLERLFPEIPIHIESFVRRRVRLDADQRIALGVKNSTLGLDFTAGQAVVDRSGRFRVVMGPVSYGLYEALMPGGQAHARLRTVVDRFTRGTLEAELELILADDAVPRFQLGKERGAVLGVTTQLRTAVVQGMRARVVLSGDAGTSRARLIGPGDEMDET